MYIRITSRCNMTCAHCAYNCTAKGADMSLKTYEAALKFSSDMGDESVSIGGGEPTMHPLFWQFLGLAMADFEYVWMATNGSKTNTALALAKMARRGVVSVALSQDSYHDPIDESVVEAFTVKRNTYGGIENRDSDLREIRNVNGKEINAGRCDFGEDSGCVCPDLLIEPDGTIKGCGCADAPTLGTVFDPQIPEGWQSSECSKEQPEID
jgi:MoaA/NifB/PqqE/SkfB family radical SAM enzyme